MTLLGIELKRAYEAPSDRDGLRVLVERLWPRGLTKAGAAIDHWLKDIAPSSELRTWYGHRPDRWPEFRRRYRAELRSNHAAVDSLRALCTIRHPCCIAEVNQCFIRNLMTQLTQHG